MYSKSLDVFTPAHQEAVSSTDPDANLGELVVKIPQEATHLMTENRPLRIGIEFSLEQPVGGLHFVVPPGEGTLAEVCYKVFNSKVLNIRVFLFFSDVLICLPMAGKIPLGYGFLA